MGTTPVAVLRLLIALISLVAKHGLWALRLQWLQLTGSRTQAQ